MCEFGDQIFGRSCQSDFSFSTAIFLFGSLLAIFPIFVSCIFAAASAFDSEKQRLVLVHVTKKSETSHECCISILDATPTSEMQHQQQKTSMLLDTLKLDACFDAHCKQPNPTHGTNNTQDNGESSADSFCCIKAAVDAGGRAKGPTKPSHASPPSRPSARIGLGARRRA